MLFGSNEKKLILIIFTIISIIIVISCILIPSIPPFKYNIQTIDMYNKIKSKVSEFNTSLEILSIRENNIYIALNDTSIDPDIDITKLLIKYNIDANNISYIPTNNLRLLDICEYNGNNIYIEIQEKYDNQYKWIIHNNEKKIFSGIMNDLSDVPRILGIYDDNIIIYTVDFDENKIKHFSFFKVNNDQIIKIYEGIGSSEKMIGVISYNIPEFYINDKSLYFTIYDNINNQILYEYDLKNNQLKQLYKNTDHNKTIYAYKIISNTIYVQLIYNNKSENRIIKNNTITEIFTDEINTFDTALNNNTILFHNRQNKWKILNLQKEKFIDIDIKLPQKNILPKIHYISENKILAESFDGKFYIIEISM